MRYSSCHFRYERICMGRESLNLLTRPQQPRTRRRRPQRRVRQATVRRVAAQHGESQHGRDHTDADDIIISTSPRTSTPPFPSSSSSSSSLLPRHRAPRHRRRPRIKPHRHPRRRSPNAVRRPASAANPRRWHEGGPGRALPGDAEPGARHGRTRAADRGVCGSVDGVCG